MTRAIRLLAVLSMALASCSPVDWTAVQSAGSTVGAAVDTFALVRAEQIRAKSAEAQRAAASGDTLGALRALDEAMAFTAAQSLRELAELRAELRALRATCPAAPTAPPTASAP